LSADVGGDRGIPVGFIAVVRKYPFPGETGADSVFVWFMTAAPPETLPYDERSAAKAVSELDTYRGGETLKNDDADFDAGTF
jgi:hypothetical protein